MSRFALIIGISAYPDNPLPNAAKDARRIVETLQKRGFNTTALYDATAQAIDNALTGFTIEASGADIALIFFAGHGVEYHGAGYVLPTDSPWPVTPSALKQYCISNDQLIGSMANVSGAKILIVDACRTWTSNTATILQQLDEQRENERTQNNLIVAYSTSASDTAKDGKGLSNSPYCSALCEALLRHDLSIEDCLKEAGKKTMLTTGNRQRSWSYSSLNIPISFSDLPRFALIQSFTLQLPIESEFSLTQGLEPESVVASGGSTVSWQATIRGIAPTRPIPVGKIIGCANTIGQIAYLNDVGQILISSNRPPLSTGITTPFGITSSEDGKRLLVYGGQGWALYRANQNSFSLIRSKRTTWHVYAAAFITCDRVWLSGVFGKLVALEKVGSKWKEHDVRHIPQGLRKQKYRSFKNDRYCVARTRDGRVICGGRGGYISVFDHKTRRATLDIELNKRVVTPAARRSSLLDMMDDEHLYRFLFHPETLPPDICLRLESDLLWNDILACAAHPFEPIIAVGTSEGLVHLIDDRDGQVFQTIDIVSGRATRTQGLCFTPSGILCVLSKDATVGFYAANPPSRPTDPLSWGEELSNEEDELDEDEE